MEFTELAKLIVERWGAAGAVIVALGLFAWKLNGKIALLKEQLIQGKLDTMQAEITTIRNKVKAVDKALVRAGLWHQDEPISSDHNGEKLT